MVSRRGSGSRITPLVGAVVAAGMLLAGGFALLRAKARYAANAAAPIPSAERVLEGLLGEPASESASASAGGGAEPPGGRIADSASLKEAIALSRPRMANSVGRLDPGSALLALWASQHLEWDALQALPETSAALFRKDPDAERGRRLCATGTIHAIRAETSLAHRLSEDRAIPLIERRPSSLPSIGAAASGTRSSTSRLAADPWLEGDWTVPGGGKLYFATLLVKPPPPPGDAPAKSPSSAMKDQLVLQVIAAKNTGTLVDGSEATACGVLTGVTLPAPETTPAGLAETPQHRVVGMFDLPDNRARGAAARGAGG